MSRRAIAPPPVLPGYSYVRPLGSGGFADVYLFDQDLPRRRIAAKVLAGGLVTPALVRTFNAEADILARLSVHPAIVTIFDASISADGRPYFIMEYCPDTMGARYRRGPLPLAEVLDTGVRIGGALETVHRAGLLHRDVKPSNILVTSLGMPVLADFGIAGAAAAADDPDAIALSIPWSAPEVISGQVSGSVPSEVWSLAATLYTMLAARSPFETTTRGSNARDHLASRILAAHYTPLRREDVPERLEGALARAMSRNPGKRFPTAQAFAEELRWVQYELGLPPTPLEVAAAEWMPVHDSVGVDDDVARGPVRSVVRTDSRRNRRIERAVDEAARERRDRDGLAVRPRRAVSPLVAGLIGAGSVVAVLAIVAGVLVATGVI